MKNNWDKDRRCPSGSGNMFQEKNLPPNATLFRAAETHCLSALPLCVAALRILASFTQVEPQDAQEISLLKACQHWSAKAKCPTTLFVFLLLDDFQRPRNQSFWHSFHLRGRSTSLVPDSLKCQTTQYRSLTLVLTSLVNLAKTSGLIQHLPDKTTRHPLVPDCWNSDFRSVAPLTNVQMQKWFVCSTHRQALGL